MHKNCSGNPTLPLAAIAMLALAAPAGAVTLLTGAHDGQSGDGYEILVPGLTVVAPVATFNGNGFNGLTDFGASLLVRGGQFDGNANVGLQALLQAGQVVVVAGGSFSGNSGGLDVYGASLTVRGGTFSGNSAYGLTTHADATVRGGSFDSNGDYGIFSFGGNTAVYGGSFSGNQDGDFGASGAGSVVTVYGSFDHYGSFGGRGTFTGSLADGGAVRTFSYATFSGGALVLAQAPAALASVSAVPEPGAAWLAMAGLAVVAAVARRRAGA